MLTEDKIIQHANLLLEKRTLTNADYPGWVQGAMWAMRELEVEIAELHRRKNLYLQNWAAISKIVSQDAKDFQRKYDAALQLAGEYKEQSDRQKEQIAELVKSLSELLTWASMRSDWAEQGLLEPDAHPISNARLVLKKHNQ